MQLHRCAVGLRGDNRDLELARQKAEFRVEARPLPKQLSVRTRIDQFIRCCACKVIRADIADTITASLDRMHFHLGEVRKQVWRFFQLNPIVLNILACRKVPISAVILLRDISERMHLGRIKRPIRDRHTQHIGVQLQIQPVH